MSKNVMKKRDVDGGDLSPTSKNVATTGQSESNVFFRGRRQWPQASQIRRPREGSGVGVRCGPGVRNPG